MLVEKKLGGKTNEMQNNNRIGKKYNNTFTQENTYEKLRDLT